MLKNDKMGKYELEQGYASYKTIIEYYIGDLVLCNNITDIDENVLCHLICGYNMDECDPLEIYQYYLCHISEYDKEELQKIGILISYSDMLECDVLCVDHWGTSWDYVLTDVKLFDTYEELKEYESEAK